MSAKVESVNSPVIKNSPFILVPLGSDCDPDPGSGPGSGSFGKKYTSIIVTPVFP